MGHARPGVPPFPQHRVAVEDTMSAKKGSIRIELTPQQRELVKKATGKEGAVLELGVEELEERIAPMHARPGPRLAD